MAVIAAGVPGLAAAALASAALLAAGGRARAVGALGSAMRGHMAPFPPPIATASAKHPER